MKKLLALLVALVMALGCAMASAETIYVKTALNHEAVNSLIASFGMPEEQAGMIDPILSLVDALGIKVIAVEDGAQIDLDFNGSEALSLGCAADEKALTLVSTLFPNYALTLQFDTLTQLMNSFMPGAGEGGEASGMDLNAMMEPFMGYFSRLMEACASAAVPGEPVPGEYEFEGVKFDTLVPIAVDVPAIAESVKALADEMLNDPAVLSAIQGMAQGMAQSTGQAFDVEELKKGLDEWMAHFPDTVAAEYYTNSDGSPAFYMQGESAYEGKEEASFGYTMLFLNETNMKMSYWDKESDMSGAIEMTGNSFRLDFAMAGMTFAFDLTYELGENSVFVCKLYFMDLENPLVTVTVTVSAEGARTLPVETEGKNVLPIETLLNGEGDLNGLLGDLMTNGLGGLMASLTEAVPEMGGLLGMFMGDPSAMAVDGGAVRAGKMLLQLGTTGYAIAVDDSFVPGELTEEDIADDMVAYYRSPNTLLDFDIYQFSKEGYPETIPEFVDKEAEEYDAFIIARELDINGIPAGMYKARETYEDKEYTTATYVLLDGDEYVEITFWLDGDEAELEAMEIMYTLTYTAEAPARTGASDVPDITGDWALVYSKDGVAMLTLYLYLYEDGTLEAFFAEGAEDITEGQGMWFFDGETLILHADADFVMDWDEENHQFTGEEDGVTVTMRIPFEPEAEEEDWTDEVVRNLLAGGWTAAEDQTVTQDVEQLLWTALDRYQTGTITVSYTPVAYLGSQVVAGTNHAILCRSQEINQAPIWVIIYLYQDLQGGVSVLNIEEINLGV